MWCGVKFVVGHRYVRSQLYQLLVDEDEDNMPKIEENSNDNIVWR